MEKKTEGGGWLVVVNRLRNLKNVCLVCLPKKLGEVDRGRRPRGPLPQPGADEEQSMGGEREVHPPLEETKRPATTFNFTQPTHTHAHTLTLTHLQKTLKPDPPYTGLRRYHSTFHRNNSRYLQVSLNAP